MKRLLLIVVLFAAAAVVFANGNSVGDSPSQRVGFWLRVGERIREAVQNQLLAHRRLGPLGQDPQAAEPQEQQSRTEARTGDGAADCDGDRLQDRDRDQVQLRTGSGDGQPDRERAGRS